MTNDKEYQTYFVHKSTRKAYTTKLLCTFTLYREGYKDTKATGRSQTAAVFKRNGSRTSLKASDQYYKRKTDSCRVVIKTRMAVPDDLGLKFTPSY